MIFGLFPSGQADKFAANLAQEIARRYPPLLANNPEQTISQKRIAEILEETFATAHQINRGNRVGFVRRTILSSAFKWELREMGYEEKFVRLAIEKLAARLAAGSV